MTTPPVFTTTAFGGRVDYEPLVGVVRLQLAVEGAQISQPGLRIAGITTFSFRTNNNGEAVVWYIEQSGVNHGFVA